MKIKYTKVYMWQAALTFTFMAGAIAFLCFTLGVRQEVFTIAGIAPAIILGLLAGEYVGIK